MISKKIKISIVVAVCILIVSVFSATYLLTLKNIETWIEKYSTIQQINSTDLVTQLTGEKSTNYLIFDVRDAEEYAQSRIHSAIRVNPDMTAEKFGERFGAGISGKKIVFYCSVGGRSTFLAERVAATAQAHQAISVLNLRGGIFRWYNNGFPVYNDNGEANTVHPYNAIWKFLLKKDSQ